MFPRDIALIVADYAIIPKILDWIHPGPILKQKSLYANPRALEAGLLDNPDLTDEWVVFWLSLNPSAMHIIRANPRLFLTSNRGMWLNPVAVDWLLENGVEIDWGRLSGNTGSRAIEILTANQDKINWIVLSKNSSASAILNANPEKIEWDCVLANYAMIEYIKTAQILDHDDWSALSLNPHPWAIEHLRANWDEINVPVFARNPGIFKSERDPALVKILSA